jgi:hypothetical protein
MVETVVLRVQAMLGGPLQSLKERDPGRAQGLPDRPRRADQLARL